MGGERTQSLPFAFHVTLRKKSRRRNAFGVALSGALSQGSFKEFGPVLHEGLGGTRTSQILGLRGSRLPLVLVQAFWAANLKGGCQNYGPFWGP